MAALDWFGTEVAPPPPAVRPAPRPRARPAAAPRRRARTERRVTGQLAWISLFALLLAGVVAVNVAVLRSNMNVDRLDRMELQLQAQNQALASQVSSAASAQRIEQTAQRLGLVPAPATDTSYLDLGRKQK